ncbi:MAG: hypothetical protein KDA85_21445 [Planctomycetaceae bacterium]|nr:hypothetical protein [Planctomycetaceae bacterium]
MLAVLRRSLCHRFDQPILFDRINGLLIMTHLPVVRLLRALFCCFLMATALTGCHCCGLKDCTENYADLVDHVSESSPCLDNAYCEELDVTRWCMNQSCCNCRHGK